MPIGVSPDILPVTVKSKHALLLGVTISVLAVAAFAVWDAGRRPRWRPVAEGVQFARYTVSPVRYHALARVAAIRVDLARARIGVVEAPSGKACVRDLVRSHTLLGGINGTYFDENDRPLGLTITQGRPLTPLRKADWGVFYVDDSGAHLAHTREYTGADTVRFAIQCGPRLVVDGRPVKLKLQSARRTAIGVDADGHILLVVTTGQPFRADHFARLLAASPAAGGLGCRDALNLDGGASSQMYLSAGGVTCNVRGADAVANAVVVQTRTASTRPSGAK